jgi:hypothetical protein
MAILPPTRKTNTTQRRSVMMLPIQVFGLIQSLVMTIATLTMMDLL